MGREAGILTSMSKPALTPLSLGPSATVNKSREVRNLAAHILINLITDLKTKSCKFDAKPPIPSPSPQRRACTLCLPIHASLLIDHLFTCRVCTHTFHHCPPSLDSDQPTPLQPEAALPAGFRSRHRLRACTQPRKLALLRKLPWKLPWKLPLRGPLWNCLQRRALLLKTTSRRSCPPPLGRARAALLALIRLFWDRQTASLRLLEFAVPKLARGLRATGRLPVWIFAAAGAEARTKNSGAIPAA